MSISQNPNDKLSGTKAVFWVANVLPQWTVHVI